MKTITVCTAAAAILVVAIASAPALKAQGSERQPNFNFSLAQDPTGEATEGPLFKRTLEAFDAAHAADGSGFGRFLAPDPDLEMSFFANGERQSVPFDARTIRAATGSCLGPYAFDESSSWVQLSWVCRTDAAAPLAKLLTFRNSPELSLTIWFEGGLIKSIDAMEPLPVPGRPLLTMNAYEVMKPAG